MSKSLRRHHAQRIKAKRKVYWGGIKGKRMLGIVASTPAICSCVMCCNRRKLEGATIQERGVIALEKSCRAEKT